MKAEIMSVGTELLLGDILNTDAQYLARSLAALGIDVYYQSVVGDNPERLKETFKLAFSRADLVITTGGLGPTKDDLTKETAFEYFNKKSVLHEESLKRIESYFKESHRKMVESNKKQAYFPDDAIIMPNDYGTAPGCIINESGNILAIFPGPPKEMRPMFEHYFIPYIEKFQEHILYSKVLRIIGIGESSATDMIQDLIDRQTNPTIASYAKQGEVTFRITAKAKSEEEAKKLIKPVEDEIKNRMGINFYGEGEDTIEKVVGEILTKNKLTISTAESCTGGLLAGRIINYSGISSVFLEGAITYSNEAKMKRLGVKKETLEKFGAVSKETAEEMAIGIAKYANTNIGISTTGVAGPNKSEDKPVGLVYIGVYINGHVETKELHLNGDRQRIRNSTAMIALDFLRRELISNKYK